MSLKQLELNLEIEKIRSNKSGNVLKWCRFLYQHGIFECFLFNLKYLFYLLLFELN